MGTTTAMVELLAIALAAQTLTAQAALPDFAEAHRLIRDGMAKDSVPGLAIAVIRGTSILWEEGFGWADREGRVAATASSPFPLASITKTFVATAAMALYEQRRLALDGPANDYLGASRLWSPKWDPSGATVRRLMMHTSGLTTFDLHCAAAQPHCHLPTAGETIRRYGVLVWPPGEQFDYSNLGYDVLGEVVARSAGRELGAVLRDDVFRPLGMTHSSLGVDPALLQQTAIAYSWTRGPLPRDTSGTRHLSGASSAYASAHDLAMFAAFHMKVPWPDQRAILSNAAIDTMQHSVVSAAGSSEYGLGWWVDEDRYGYRSLLAQGGNDAANAWLRLIPSERIAVAVLANKGVGFPSTVVDAVLASLLPRYADGLAAQRARSAAAASSRTTSRSTPTVVDSAFVGLWSGIVRTADGDVPLALTLTHGAEVLGTIGSRRVLGRAQFGDGLLRLAIPGDLQTADTTHSPRELSFYLAPRGSGLLNGTLTTNPDRASGLDGRVSYWVEITKRP